ncbi:hypothetical protein Tco_0465324 [Tanacetum coccineum]
MSNSNTNLQTQSSNALHNVSWKRVAKNVHQCSHGINYVQITISYSIVDALSEACECGKAIARSTSLQPEMAKVVTLVKQSHRAEDCLYHKSFMDILKQTPE